MNYDEESHLDLVNINNFRSLAHFGDLIYSIFVSIFLVKTIIQLQNALTKKCCYCKSMFRPTYADLVLKNDCQFCDVTTNPFLYWTLVGPSNYVLLSTFI